MTKKKEEEDNYSFNYFCGKVVKIFNFERQTKLIETRPDRAGLDRGQDWTEPRLSLS